MQLSDVVMVYFVIAAVMVGGGAIDLGDAGIVTYFIEEDDTGGFEGASNPADQIDETGGAITTVVSLAVGGIVLVWQLILALLNFMFWPIATLTQNNAPPMAVLLLGGGFTAAFYMAVASTVMRSS